MDKINKVRTERSAETHGHPAQQQEIFCITKRSAQSVYPSSLIYLRGRGLGGLGLGGGGLGERGLAAGTRKNR